MVTALPQLELLPQPVLARFAATRFPVRGFMAGSKSGRHRSPYLGASTEFAQHREYSPGDEPRSLDWRALARTDRYYIRQYADETSLRATIVLDASASMNYTGDAAVFETGRPLSKFRYATHLAALLAWLLTRQGDAVGLIAFNKGIRAQIPQGSSGAHLHRLLQALSTLTPQGPSQSADVLHQVAGTVPRQGLVIVISDLLESPDGFGQALHRLRHGRHEIVVLQVLAREEAEFPFSEPTQFRDLEAFSDTWDVDPAAIRREYLAQFRSHQETLITACNQVQADLVPCHTCRSWADTLADFLAARMPMPGT